MTRHDGRRAEDLRPIHIIKSPQKDPAGSVLIEWGNTKVICSASVEEKLPVWMQNENRGWITAEYNMLPGSSDKRISRDRVRTNGRTQEIQRLIGRSLRAAVNLESLGPRSIILDCDVIQADGGTRVASITGSYLALMLAFQQMLQKGQLSKFPSTQKIAAVSVGKVKGEIVVDLDYPEDSTAELDANVVMNEKGEFVEIQGTAEKDSFSRTEFNQLLDIASTACRKIFQIQEKYMSEWGIKP